MPGLKHVRSWVASGVVSLVPVLASGAGFALFEHGARAVALGGAFGATADDPSALYYNPAGIAFLDGTQAAFGAYFITESSTFNGANTFPGQGYSVDMKKQIFYPPHLYVTGHPGGSVAWGIGVYAPFGLGTWWPSDYAGKFISKRVDLKVFNLNPNVAFKLSDNAAFAVGADYYYSSLSLTKSLGVINPYTQDVAEVGQVHLKADFTGAWGWNAAFLGKLGGGWSLGASYRSAVKTEYNGNASFIQFPTGNADFDQILDAQIPFGQKPTAKTAIHYPWEGRVGLAWHGQAVGIEADVVRQGWSSFYSLPILLPDYPMLSSVRPEQYKNSNTYRLGIEYRTSPKFSWLFGLLYDETPVPTGSVSPLLPDSTRRGISAGFSWMVGPRTQFDVGYLHLPFGKRSTQGQDQDNFNGNYNTRAELLGFTLTFRL